MIVTVSPTLVLSVAPAHCIDDYGIASGGGIGNDELYGIERVLGSAFADTLKGGRTSSRVTSRHFDYSNASLAFMSRSNRPYGLTCSRISGVRAE